MRNQSILEQRGVVTFPEFVGTRVYMLAMQDGKVPAGMEVWQHTVDQMLDGIPAPLAYLMIDQKVLQPGETHRRPGLHMDGYWDAGCRGHDSRPPEHRGISAHGGTAPAGPQHRPSPRHTGWETCDFSTPEATLLASSYGASRALTGEWEGKPGQGGDCSHIDTDGMGHWYLKPGACWAGNVAMLHASLPVSQSVARTLVRITVPGWSPSA